MCQLCHVAHRLKVVRPIPAFCLKPGVACLRSSLSLWILARVASCGTSKCAVFLIFHSFYRLLQACARTSIASRCHQRKECRQAETQSPAHPHPCLPGKVQRAGLLIRKSFVSPQGETPPSVKGDYNEIEMFISWSICVQESIVTSDTPISC